MWQTYRHKLCSPACTVLLNLDTRLRAERRGMLDLGPDFTLDRLVLKLLGTVADTGDRTQIVEDLCNEVRPMMARLRLLRSVGRRSNPETDRLVPAGGNQSVDNMGFYNALNACFSLHQIIHSHWAELNEDHYPDGTPQFGVVPWNEAPPVPRRSAHGHPQPLAPSACARSRFASS